MWILWPGGQEPGSRVAFADEVKENALSALHSGGGGGQGTAGVSSPQGDGSVVGGDLGRTGCNPRGDGEA